MQHVDLSCNCNGMTRKECVVRPSLFKRQAAIPLVAIAIHLTPRSRRYPNILLYTKVLPVPPGPSKKNSLFEEEGSKIAVVTALKQCVVLCLIY